MANCDPGPNVSRCDLPGFKIGTSPVSQTEFSAAKLAVDHSRNTVEASMWTHPRFSPTNPANPPDFGVLLLDFKQATLSLPVA
jgi:hypothetical protein